MDTQQLTQERIALNQSTFRKANEKIEVAADEMALLGWVPFICECADRRCTELVRLTLDEYQQVRQHPRRFFNALGHEAISVEAGADEVVETRKEYVIVDKIGVAGEISAEEYEELPDDDSDE